MSRGIVNAMELVSKAITDPLQNYGIKTPHFN